jgi:hypothetical protein
MGGRLLQARSRGTPPLAWINYVPPLPRTMISAEDFRAPNHRSSANPIPLLEQRLRAGADPSHSGAVVFFAVPTLLSTPD